jgi:NTP pyrophosphatase (non-canonical NTP hydrolase)
MATVKDLTKKIIDFRDARDWKQFHNPKDLSLSLVLEASEVMEHFQWKNAKEVKKYTVEAKEEIGDELADVLSYLLTLSHDLNIDLELAFKNKLKKSDLKYPIEKSKGKHTKYNKL